MKSITSRACPTGRNQSLVRSKYVRSTGLPVCAVLPGLMAPFIACYSSHERRQSSCQQLHCRTEVRMVGGSLLGVVGGGVAPDHKRTGVTQKVLDIQLPS